MLCRLVRARLMGQLNGGKVMGMQGARRHRERKVCSVLVGELGTLAVGGQGRAAGQGGRWGWGPGGNDC
jgi:hypothetical protein